MSLQRVQISKLCMLLIEELPLWFDMIPIPPSSNRADTLVFYRAVVDNLKIRSSHHESWHTHKRDTSVCWICDLLEVSTIMISEMERFISKSALDIDEQFHDSEVDSDYEGEIENGSSENIPGDN